jgi:hypothetical protein
MVRKVYRHRLNIGCSRPGKIRDTKYFESDKKKPSAIVIPLFPPPEEECKVGETYFHKGFNCPVTILAYDKEMGTIDIRVERLHGNGEIRRGIESYPKD